jgi:hypothetical protein
MQRPPRASGRPNGYVHTHAPRARSQHPRLKSQWLERPGSRYRAASNTPLTNALNFAFGCLLLSPLQQKYGAEEGLTREERAQRSMQDPEIQAIMGDPVMQQILKQMQEDPSSVQEYVSSASDYALDHRALIFSASQPSLSVSSAQWLCGCARLLMVPVLRASRVYECLIEWV